MQLRRLGSLLLTSQSCHVWLLHYALWDTKLADMQQEQNHWLLLLGEKTAASIVINQLVDHSFGAVDKNWTAEVQNPLCHTRWNLGHCFTPRRISSDLHSSSAIADPIRWRACVCCLQRSARLCSESENTPESSENETVTVLNTRWTRFVNSRHTHSSSTSLLFLSSPFFTSLCHLLAPLGNCGAPDTATFAEYQHALNAFSVKSFRGLREESNI